MCQAYEGERNYISGTEADKRAEGYAAFQEGRPRNSNPHQDGLVDRRTHWFYGWDTAERGERLW